MHQKTNKQTSKKSSYNDPLHAIQKSSMVKSKITIKKIFTTADFCFDRRQQSLTCILFIQALYIKK